MKKILFITTLFITPLFCFGQTVNISYLNPQVNNGNPYIFTRFGNAATYWGGFMWNNTSPTYGDGDDFSIFTYNNRDITLQTGTGNVIIFPNSGGNVGIGTKAPNHKLEVIGSSGIRLSNSASPSDSWMTIMPSVSVASLNPGGTTVAAQITSRDKGHLVVDIKANDSSDSFAVRTDSDFDGTVDIIPFVVKATGRVGIGTTTPDATLAVNGDIHTQEVRVDMTGWPDFVFNKDYTLPTLKEVETHIKENGHLKDIPSEAEVKANGINLGEMDAKLLQKIEELTLYTIEQQKLIEAVYHELSTIRQENKRLHKEIEAIKNK